VGIVVGEACGGCECGCECAEARWENVVVGGARGGYECVETGAENVLVGGARRVRVRLQLQVPDVSEQLLAVCRARIAGIEEDMGPCLEESESGAGHLATSWPLPFFLTRV
jgi:hypothetical protein